MDEPDGKEDKMPKNRPLISWNGIDIDGKNEMLSLTAMWRSEGSPDGKRPARWLETEQATRFIEFIADTLNIAKNDIYKTTRGRDGATMAHWQIAMAYAKYLSHPFHAHVNATYKKAREAEQKRLDARAVSIEVRNEYTHELGVHGCRSSNDFKQCTNAGYLGLYGTDAKGLRLRKQLPTGSNIRANMGLGGLAAVMFMESRAVERIKSTPTYGVDDCAKATHACALIVKRAIEDERRTRGPEMINP